LLPDHGPVPLYEGAIGAISPGLPVENGGRIWDGNRLWERNSKRNSLKMKSNLDKERKWVFKNVIFLL